MFEDQISANEIRIASIVVAFGLIGATSWASSPAPIPNAGYTLTPITATTCVPLLPLRRGPVRVAVLDGSS